MKLFKYTLILGTSLFIFSNTANAIFAVEHRSFSGNGDPKVEEFAKKCQAVEDERYNTAILQGKRFDQVLASNHRPDQDKKYLELDQKTTKLHQKLVDMKCIRY